MAGTFQLCLPLPSQMCCRIEALRYWGVHAGVVILALFGYFAMGLETQTMDIIWSGLAMNATALIIYPYNCLTHSNYFFLNAKPPGTTLYSLLPEWPGTSLPWKVLIFLFSIIYAIFQFTPSLCRYLLLWVRPLSWIDELPRIFEPGWPHSHECWNSKIDIRNVIILGCK